ncbi:MAG: hypothetical protein ACFFDN_47845 [Candidatus Hodarchaeota archaeon]
MDEEIKKLLKSMTEVGNKLRNETLKNKIWMIETERRSMFMSKDLIFSFLSIFYSFNS